MVLTAFLAYQAQDALRSHRRAAERLIGDYADLAASEYVRRILPELDYYAYEPALRRVAEQRNPAHPERLPVPAPIKVWISDERGDTELAIDLVRYYFHLSFADRGKLVTRGVEPSPATCEWLADTLAAHARSTYKSEWRNATIIGPAAYGAHRVIYRVERDASGVSRTAFGFEADSAGMNVYFRYANEVLSLIPAQLTGDVAQDSLVALLVAAPDGAILYRSDRQHRSAFTAEKTLGPRFGNLAARATLHPSFAATIPIQGPPSAQRKLLLGIAIVTMVLMTAAIVQLRREAELARLKSDFVSSVSHELRTPLAQMRLFAETLLLGRVRSEDEAKRALAIIDQEARRMTHLVENVLHFARAERRVIQLSTETVELEPLVREIVEGFAHLASTRLEAIDLDLERGIVARADPGAVRQMLINLLDNAVKYGPEGQRIRVGLRRIAAPNGSGHRARLWIDDQGPGIDARDRKRIWERFTRLATNNSAPVAGAGIGLAVVRELAELHVGRAWAEDAPGGGSRFLVELPAANP